MRCLQLSVLSVLTAFPFANFAMPFPPPWDDIRPHDENALRDAFYKVSDPRSPKYGAHLSKEQVAQLVAPHPDTLDLIDSWLGHHAVPSSSVSTTHGSSWLKLTGILVSQANELLGASYQVYRRIGTNDSSILRLPGAARQPVLRLSQARFLPRPDASYSYFVIFVTMRNPLGFLNLWLYDIGIYGLNDITSGSNLGCGTDGFTAITGWDLVTGLGTPNFLALLQTLDYMDEDEETHNEGIRATFSERLNNSDTTWTTQANVGWPASPPSRNEIRSSSAGPWPLSVIGYFTKSDWSDFTRQGLCSAVGEVRREGDGAWYERKSVRGLGRNVGGTA
ncbi:Pro-kumamolisin, activation domain-containing protein [Lactarius hengduanensis]|nr:Pro-kumamolisin, activation domain-containing protein [Lactarius hengduanensis]